MGAKRGTVAERFYRNVDKTTTCWLWTASKNPHGYGRLNVDGNARLAHRVSYEIAHGPVPVGKMVCHSCDTPACVNPDHLFAASQYDNMQDMARKGRAPVTKGEKCGKAKLKEPQVLEIRQSSEIGRVLADRYGVSMTAIYNIKKGARWGHI